jgi:hypothetical protein
MERFLTKVSTTYNIDTELILKEWKDFDLLHTTYNKMKKPELVDLCKEKGFKSSGSKIELIGYLFDEVVDVPKEAKVVSKKPKVEKSSPVSKASIIKKLITEAPTVIIRRNDHGNHEHVESGFVFDSKTKQVIGKQQTDGSVVPICKADIDICNKYAFSYTIPESLGASTDQEDVVDKEIDDEIDEDNLIEEEEDDSDDEIEY